jgi:flagellar hook-length control protein FliK
MQGLGKIQASGIKASPSNLGLSSKKTRAPKETEFDSRLKKADVSDIAPNSIPLMQQQNYIKPTVAKGEQGGSKQPDSENPSNAEKLSSGTLMELESADQKDIYADPSESKKLSQNGTSETRGSTEPLKMIVSPQTGLELSSSQKQNGTPVVQSKEAHLKNTGQSLDDLQKNFSVTVNYAPLSPESLANQSQINPSDRLWYPLPKSEMADSADTDELSSLTDQIEQMSDDPGVESRRSQANLAAERVLKTNLSGSDFINTLNSTQLLDQDLPIKGASNPSERLTKDIGGKTTNSIAQKKSSLLDGSALHQDVLENDDIVLGNQVDSPVFGKVAVQNGGKSALGRNSPALENLSKNGLNARQDIRDLKSSGRNLSEELAKNLTTISGHPGAKQEVESSGPAQVSGNVVSGTMARERLSTESLTSLSTNIRGMSGQGGGEIRMRLNPENLGELNIRVSTSGNRVELHIQASDDRSKKIIEESIGYLKDSLNSQNLSLANVDFSVAHQVAANGDFNSDPRFANSQSGFQDALGQQGSRGDHWGGGGSERSFARDAEALARPLTSRLSSHPGRQYSSGNLAKSGRIDVRG